MVIVRVVVARESYYLFFLLGTFFWRLRFAIITFDALIPETKSITDSEGILKENTVFP